MENQDFHNQTPIKEKKDIYSVGFGSIFFRNFTAGFSHALGAITVYLILGGIIYYLVISYLLPQIQKIIPATLPSLGPIPLYQQLMDDSNHTKSTESIQQEFQESTATPQTP